MRVIMQHDRTIRDWPVKKVKKLTVEGRKTKEDWIELQKEMKKLGIYAFELSDLKKIKDKKRVITLNFVKQQILLR